MEPKIEDLLQDNDVKHLLSKYKKKTNLPRPHRSDIEIDFSPTLLKYMRLWPFTACI